MSEMMSESMEFETRVKVLEEENEKLKAALADVKKILNGCPIKNFNFSLNAEKNY